jgi:hypothetical protein
MVIELGKSWFLNLSQEQSVVQNFANYIISAEEVFTNGVNTF